MRKLLDLLADGYVVDGVSFSNANRKGFITTGGFVGWWHGADAPGADAEDAARYRWLRASWGRIADEYDGDSDQLVAIRESDSHFEGWDVDPVSLDRAIDAARAQAKKGST